MMEMMVRVCLLLLLLSVSYSYLVPVVYLGQRQTKTRDTGQKGRLSGRTENNFAVE